MIPKRVTLENFLSFGEKQELEFTDDEALWVLSGPNGVGKSAVFDAITYCLFGEHRAGSQGAKELIRHGQNSFRVSFEFIFDNIEYRIIRTLGRTARGTSQSVETKSSTGEWGPVAGVNLKGEVSEWVKQTIGLDYTAFTASVLLKQGESDAMVNASGGQRLQILKRIINVERFEKLAKEIDEARKGISRRLDDLMQTREGTTEVTEADVDAANSRLQLAIVARDAAAAAVNQAVQKRAQAQQFEAREKDAQELDARLQAAEARARDRDTIVSRHERLLELGKLVPLLQTINAAQRRLNDLAVSKKDCQFLNAKMRDDKISSQTSMLTARQKVDALKQLISENQKRAEQLEKEVEREARTLESAEAIAQLETELMALPADLESLFEKAQEQLHTAEEVLQADRSADTEAKTHLKQSRQQREEFQTLGGVCPRCRQKVDEQHALKESQNLDQEIMKWNERANFTSDQIQKSQDAVTVARKNCDALERKRLEKSRLSTMIAGRKASLESLGIQVQPNELRQQLEAKRLEASRCQQQAKMESEQAQIAQKEHDRFEEELVRITNDLSKLEEKIQLNLANTAREQGLFDLHLEQLSPDWQVRVPLLECSVIHELDAERALLEQSGVRQQFDALQQDVHKIKAWSEQRERLRKELESLEKITVVEAEEQLKTAEALSVQAQQVRDDAKEEANRLTREQAAFRQLVESIAQLEKQHDRHKKLSQWLGSKGLQRELVREAELEIVRLAKETLHNLSNGDLDISLQPPRDDKDEALVLEVRRADDPEPIGVKYLSGSQKFRVAVAIAVAIGKFAAGPKAARPLESVIIDEGFGSLDKEGLRAMRDELENLKNLQALKRVILVSHQEEFTSNFPVGYRLEPGENGTQAKRYSYENV